MLTRKPPFTFTENTPTPPLVATVGVWSLKRNGRSGWRASGLPEDIKGQITGTLRGVPRSLSVGRAVSGSLLICDPSNARIVAREPELIRSNRSHQLAHVLSHNPNPKPQQPDPHRQSKPYVSESKHILWYPRGPLEPNPKSVPSGYGRAIGPKQKGHRFRCGRYRTRTCDPLLVRNKRGLEYLGFAGPTPVFISI